MVNIPTQKLIYSNEITKVTNTTFDVYTPPIAKTGENSHETLINRSSEYIGLNLQSLYNQLKELQIQNELLQQQIDAINNGGTN
jgi:hypothetical protein